MDVVGAMSEMSTAGYAVSGCNRWSLLVSTGIAEGVMSEMDIAGKQLQFAVSAMSEMNIAGQQLEFAVGVVSELGTAGQPSSCG